MANLLPNVRIYLPDNTTVLCRIFFRTVLESVRFKTLEDPLANALPLCFIYEDILYWEKGKPFLFNNELLKYAPDEVNCLAPKYYKTLYKHILELGGFLEVTPKVNVVETPSADHMIDAISYNIPLRTAKEIEGGQELEKEVIDRLEIPGLENSLNEAIRLENYEAAAYIRIKVCHEDYLIFEDNGKLKIRRRKK